MTDERTVQLLRLVPALLADTYVGVCRSAQLLEEKSQLCPSSAEARAHAILATLQQSLRPWFAEGGETELLGRLDPRSTQLASEQIAEVKP